MLSTTSLASVKQLSDELEIKSLIEIFEETREQLKWHFPAYRFSEVESIDFYWGFYLGEQLIGGAWLVKNHNSCLPFQEKIVWRAVEIQATDAEIPLLVVIPEFRGQRYFVSGIMVMLGFTINRGIKRVFIEISKQRARLYRMMGWVFHPIENLPPVQCGNEEFRLFAIDTEGTYRNLQRLAEEQRHSAIKQLKLLNRAIALIFTKKSF